MKTACAIPRSASSASTARANGSAAATRAAVEPPGALPGCLGRRLRLALQTGQLRGRALEPFQRPARRPRRLDHLGERRGIPAFELGERLETGLDVLEPGRVGLETCQVPAELGGRVLDADRDVVERRRDAGQLGRERRDAGDLLGGARRELAGALAVGGAQELGGRTRGRCELVEMPQPLALGPERVGLPG